MSDYPADETDLTAEQMDSLMEGAEPVEIVVSQPLVQWVSHPANRANGPDYPSSDASFPSSEHRVIEVPEELIERAAEAVAHEVARERCGHQVYMDGRHNVHAGDKRQARTFASVALAAVLPDLIATIEAEYEQVGLVKEARLPFVTEGSFVPTHAIKNDDWDRSAWVPVFVRRVP